MIIPRRTNALVSITFEPTAITCSWVSRKKNQFLVHAYQHIPLHHLELEQLVIFNPTFLKQHIMQFLDTHDLKNAQVGFILQGPALKEEFVTCPLACPKKEELMQVSSEFSWDYSYLYPTEQGDYLFYVYGLPKQILFQYQLLAISCNLHLIAISPRNSCLLQLYKHWYGSAFRQVQLAYDLKRAQHIMHQLFTPDMISRMIFLPPTNDEGQQNLLSSCGLYVAQGDAYEERKSYQNNFSS